ncbi:trichohyalin-like [Lineus longissimus]|uniref:trichohyalin-like n=1 Tax=Lineus longissimus TaxID=88925 RepID=UPI00315DF36B
MDGRRNVEKKSKSEKEDPLTDEEKRELVEVRRQEEKTHKEKLDKLQSKIEDAQVSRNSAKQREEDATRQREVYHRQKEKIKVEKAEFHEAEKAARNEVEKLRATFDDTQKVANGEEARRENLIADAEREKTEAQREVDLSNEEIKANEELRAVAMNDLAAVQSRRKDAQERVNELAPKVAELEKKKTKTAENERVAQNRFDEAEKKASELATELGEANLSKTNADEDVESISSKLRSYKTDLNNLKPIAKTPEREKNRIKLEELKKNSQVELKKKEKEKERYGKEVEAKVKDHAKATKCLEAEKAKLEEVKTESDDAASQFKSMEMKLKDAEFQERTNKTDEEIETKNMTDCDVKINAARDKSKRALERKMAALETLERVNCERAQHDVAEINTELGTAKEKEREIKTQIKMAEIRISEAEGQIEELSQQISQATKEFTEAEKIVKDTEKEHKKLHAEWDSETKRCNRIHLALYMFLNSHVVDARLRTLKHALSTIKTLGPAIVDRIQHVDELWDEMDKRTLIEIGNYCKLRLLFEMMSDGQMFVAEILEAEDKILRPYKGGFCEERTSVEADGTASSVGELVRQGSKGKLEASRDDCMELLHALYKPIEDKLAQNKYDGPRGYHEHSSEMQLLQRKYLQSGELGDQKYESLNDFLLEKIHESDNILDKQLEHGKTLETLRSDLSESEKKIEDQKTEIEDLKLQSQRSKHALEEDLQDAKLQKKTADVKHLDDIGRKKEEIQALKKELEDKERNLRQNAEQREGEQRRQIVEEKERRERAECVQKCLLNRVEDFNKETKRKDKKHAAEMEVERARVIDAKREWEKKLAESDEQWKKELEIAEEECLGMIEKVRSSKDTIIADLNEQIKDFQTQSEQRMQSFIEMQELCREQVENEKKRSQKAREDERAREEERTGTEAMQKKRFTERHATEVENLKERIASLQGRVTSLEVEKSKLQTANQSMADRYKTEIEQLKSRHEIRLKGLKDQLEKSEADIKNLKASHKHEIARLFEKYSASSAEHAQRHENESAYLKKIIADLKEERQKDITEKVQQLEREAHAMQEKMEMDTKPGREERELRSKEEKASANRKTRVQEMNEMKTDLERELRSKLEKRYGDRVRELQGEVAKLEARLKTQEAKHVADIARVEKRHEEARKRADEHHRSTVKNRDEKALRDLEDGAMRHQSVEKQLEDRLDDLKQYIEKITKDYQDRDEKCHSQHKAEMKILEEKYRREIQEQKEAARNHLRETTETLHSRLQDLEGQLKDLEARFVVKDDECMKATLRLDRYVIRYGAEMSL